MTSNNWCYVKSHPTDKPASAGFLLTSGRQHPTFWRTITATFGFLFIASLSGIAMSSKEPSSILDDIGLPAGVPDAVYATWLAVSRELNHTSNPILSEQNYRFCCGYVQALEDAQVIDERICRFLKNQIYQVWLERQKSLNLGGL